jgi:hypothetical protein
MANQPAEPITKHVRLCVGCAQHDDHPRHVIAMPGGQVANWHMDCHVLATDCEVCTKQIADADGAKGDELRGHLLSLPKED